MAFIQNTTSDNGLNAQNAYHRIDSISGNQESIYFTLNAYPSQEFYLENKDVRPIFSKAYVFKPDVSDVALNIFKQEYEYLKTLLEYENVIDVLEEGQSN